MARDGLLFYGNSLRELIETLERRLRSAVDGWDRDRLLKTSEHDLIKYLVDTYSLETISLNSDDKYIESEGETQIDVSRRWEYDVHDRNGPYYVPGAYVTIAIPFDGNSVLFGYQASTHSLNPPRGRVVEDRILITFQNVELKPEELKSEIDRTINQINESVGWINKDCESWNRRVETIAGECIRVRKARLLAQSGVVEALGIPIKRRTDAPKTFSVPVSRRRRPVSLPPVSTEAFKPEPALPESEYDYILNVIDNLSKSIERSPTTFSNMGEEQIRDLILVDLNGHYEGDATGETFNANGKTDILIRADGRNVFIAECKYWSGPKALLGAIDQILGYLTWRDTKAALLIFNRNKDFTEMIGTARRSMQEHPQYKRDLDEKSETHSRYVFMQKDDPGRDIYLALLMFDVPQ